MTAASPRSAQALPAARFPADRSLRAQSPCRSTLSTTLPLEAIGSEPIRDVVAFAALLSLARLFGFGSASAKRGAHRFVMAEFAPDMTLKDALASVRDEDNPTAEELDLEILETGEAPAGSDLALAQALDGDQLRLSLSYDASRIAPSSAQDFLEKIKIVATALKRSPETCCGSLELVSDIARDLTPDLSRPIAARPFESAPARFLRQAALHPGQPAIEASQGRYSYAELSRAVRDIAARLREAGLEQGDVVAIHGFMSFGAIAAMIGTLAAGGVLVTVDLALPKPRRNLIVEIAKPRFHIRVARQNEGEPDLPTPDWPSAADLAALPDVAFQADREAQGAAYIFFTSGSTGAPKGVAGTQLGLAHFLDWQRGRFPIGPGDRAAQITALSFDVVLRDVLFPLTSGACLHFPESGMLLDARRMLRWIAASEINVMHCVPSLMKAWLRGADDSAPFRSLKYIFFAGEPLSDALLGPFVRAAGERTRIVNLYGPTETTLAKLAHEIDHIEPGVQPVGQPQPGVDAIILRDRRFLCGLWETGEIAIRTPYRSRGYIGKPELTSEVFRANPFGNDPDDLIYFTGDLGRLRPDGRIEIFGRIDGQIKIHGVRIEPTEIEAQILKLSKSRDAAITARTDANGEKSLVAIVAPDAPVAPVERAAFGRKIREALRERMIEAMVPAAVVVVDALPYLPNGKIDRTALRKLAEAEIVTRSAPEPLLSGEPNNASARLIARWRAIFPNKLVSEQSSFISLEGDSLSYVNALIELEDVLGDAPEDWHMLTIGDLAGLKKVHKPSWFSNIEGSIALRAIGISLVVANHFQITKASSATTILFLVSGYIFGTLQLKEVIAKDSSAPILRLIRSVLLPYFLFLVPVGYLMLPQGVPLWPTLLFVADLLPHNSPLLEGSDYLWYVHCLIHILLFFLLIYHLSHWLGRGGKAVYDALAVCIAIGLFGSILLPRLLFPDLEAARYPENAVYFWPTSHIANFTLAAAAAIARKPLKHIVSAITALFPLPGIAFFGKGPAIFIPISAFFLYYHNNIKIPKFLAPLIYNIAGGSLFIYFFHFQIQILMMDVLGLSKYFAFIAALAGGVLAWRLWGKLQSLFARRFQQGVAPAPAE
jgi:amino acid adenylation domain-containing protein